MVSSDTTVSDEIMIRRAKTRYHWPEVQLNFWLLIMIVGTATILGIFANFMAVQTQLQVGTPWYFPYWVTVAAITLVFILTMLWLINQRQLLPGIVMMGSFICFVLWMVGLVVISLQLWGPSGSVNGDCNIYVISEQSKGASIETLAWLEQRSICQCWTAVWAFQLVGCIFLLWMMIMAYQVYTGQ
ncbi:hypothetical protein BJ878DRAFT_482951 [Calycina marina]|uniref:Arginase-like protein n=1 Tax=Calycina marina TaxID=1763456 RepID=A0A9P7YWR7_9HELO|nr:hypothetical protein BJ878DRAFT_482951 [Calycina marina]